MKTQTSSEQGHNAKIIHVNGLSFVASLKWVSLQKPNSYMREARTKGKEMGMDIVAIRRSATVLQAGFLSAKRSAIGKARSPELKKMYSLAAALHGTLGDNWIGAFKIEEDQYAVVAVVRGAISPMADRIYDKQQSIRKLNELGNLISPDTERETLKWYTPPELELYGEEKKLEDLLKPENMEASFKLKPLAFGLAKHEWIMVAATIVSIVILSVAWHAWQLEKAKQEERARKIKEAQLRALNEKAKNKGETIEALAHPWIKIPNLSQFIKDCSAAEANMPLTIKGWQFSGYDCNGSEAVAHYKRQGNSTVGEFIQAAHKLSPNEPALLNNANSAALKWVLTTVPGGDDKLASETQMLANLASHFQALGIDATFTRVTDDDEYNQKTLPGEQKGENHKKALPDWKTNKFVFTSNMSPSLIFNGYTLEGVRMKRVSAEFDTGSTNINWQYEGVFYAK